jgi:hypothetical protein
MGRFNPNYPTVLGNEFAPTALDPLAVDTGSAFGYTFRTTDVEDLQAAAVLMTEPPPGQPLRKVVTVEVYPDANAPGTGPMRKIIVPAASGANVTGTTLVNAATYLEALENPTDGKGVLMSGPSAALRLWFDTSVSNNRLTQVLQNARIIDVSVLYAASGRFDDYAVPMTMYLERPSAAVTFEMDNTIRGAVGLAEHVVPRRSRLGDYNPFYTTTINPNTDPRRGPWKHLNGSSGYTGLQAMSASGGTNVALRFQTSPDVAAALGAFTLHYVALEITYAAEGRVAAGGYDLSGGAALLDQMFYVPVPLMNTTSFGTTVDLPGGYDYAVAVGQGYVGNISITYPVPVTVDRLRPARDTFRGHRGFLMRKTLRAGEEWTREDDPAIPAVVMSTLWGVFDSATLYNATQPYSAQLPMAIAQLTFPGDTYARLLDTEAGRTYTHIRFYARRYPNTRDYLRLYVADTATSEYIGPEASITVEEFDALPEIANGWKEVTLPLSAPWVSTGAGVVQINMDAATDDTFPWEVLAADANPYRDGFGYYDSATYGDTDAFARLYNVDDYNADGSIMLVQALPVPGTLEVAAAVQPLTVVDEYCGVPVGAMPTGIRYHELSWDPVNDLSVAGFGYYEVQRRDTTMDADVWETVATITDVTVTAMDDYEARVGVESTYRIRTVHEDGYTSDWSDTAAATIAAPGVTGVDVDRSVLILTSNEDPSLNLAYTMAFEGTAPPQQEFIYPEGDRTELQEMYGRDYRVAFRPLERSGTEFTRTLMLNAAGVPTETLDRTASPLRDTAWAVVPYVCTRDELANRWLTALSVPSSATRDVPVRGHLVMAPVTFAEVTGTPAPVDYAGGCHGLRLEGQSQYQYWRAEAPAALGGTRVITDTFSRVVASGWGNADTGQTWSASGGGAAGDYNVTGSAGTINSTNATVERRQLFTPAYDHHRQKVSVTVPATATGAPFHFGLLTRYQDFNNYYYVRVRCATGGSAFELQLVQVVAGVATTIYDGPNINTYTVGTQFHLEVMTRGTNIAARVWRQGDPMPAWANFDNDTFYRPGEDAVPQMTGRVGVMQVRETGNTNAALTLSWDDYTMDSLAMEYDWRVLVRPFSDQFNVAYGTDEFTNGADTEGGWLLQLNYDNAGLDYYGSESTTLQTSDLIGLGLVKNRQTWVRVVLTQDDGTGGASAAFYTLADDGVTWTLVDTVTNPAPNAAISPLMPGTYLTIENYDPGGVWTERYELRVDGTLVASPDFAAQPIGTELFTDAQGNDWFGPEGQGICATLE